MGSREEAQKVHVKLREILMRYGSPEHGDCIVDEICFLFGHETTIDVEKVNMKREDFLGWYVSDDEDLVLLGSDVFEDLMESGRFEMNIETLVGRCGYIPGFITDGDEDAEYDPSDVNLI